MLPELRSPCIKLAMICKNQKVAFITGIPGGNFKNAASEFIRRKSIEIDESQSETSACIELATLEFQEKTTSDARKTTVGFAEAIEELSKAENDSMVECRAVKSKFYKGRIIVDKDSQSIVGMVLIKNEQGEPWVTPPKWGRVMKC